MSLCWSHIPHCWKSHVMAHIGVSIVQSKGKLYMGLSIVKSKDKLNMGLSIVLSKG